MITRPFAYLITSLALLSATENHCIAEERTKTGRLSAREFFEYAQNRTWKGELKIGGKNVGKFSLRTRVKRPCHICETKALHLVFHFEGPFKFPPEFRTSDGGFNSVVALPEIAILSGQQCRGPDVGALHDEIRYVSCERKLADGKLKCRVQLESVPAMVRPRRATDESKRSPLPSRMVCEFTEDKLSIQGVVLDHDIQFSLTEKQVAGPSDEAPEVSPE